MFFLLPDWLKLNHLESRMDSGFSDIFSRHICFTVAEAIGVENNTASLAWKNVQKTTFEAAEMMLGPLNRQDISKCDLYWAIPENIHIHPMDDIELGT